MLIQKLAVEELNPAPYNPRISLKPGDAVWEKLNRSLDEFDLVQPIVWNSRTGNVVSGHQRLEVLKHRGLKAVDCVVVDLSLEKEKALNITLNNAAVASDWDADKLVDLVLELQDLPDFDATLTGFDEQQLRDLVLAPAEEPIPDPQSADEDGDCRMHVTLEIPPDDWEEVEPHLNELLATFPEVRLHVGGVRK